MMTIWQMFQLWKVRLDGGYARELYGEDYVDVYALNQLHYKATGNITCNNVREHMFRVCFRFLGMSVDITIRLFHGFVHCSMSNNQQFGPIVENQFERFLAEHILWSSMLIDFTHT